MSFEDFMNRVRYWDNLTAKWLMRHFYFMFFQVVLFAIFFFWFVNLFHVIDTSQQIVKDNVGEEILKTMSVNMTIIVALLLLNSFWMLYIFNAIQRLHGILKDVSYNLSRLRYKFK